MPQKEGKMRFYPNKRRRWPGILAAGLIWLAVCGCVLTDAALGNGAQAGTETPAPTPTAPPWPTGQPSPAAVVQTAQPAAAEPAACIVIGTQGEALNIRRGPGLIWPVLSVLTPGQTVEIYPGAAWHTLASGGYISAKYCEVLP